jgi:hypothetical protein
MSRLVDRQRVRTRPPSFPEISRTFPGFTAKTFPTCPPRLPREKTATVPGAMGTLLYSSQFLASHSFLACAPTISNCCASQHPHQSLEGHPEGAPLASAGSAHTRTNNNTITLIASPSLARCVALAS